MEDSWNPADAVNRIIDYKPRDKNENLSELGAISKIGPQIIRPIFNAWEEVVIYLKMEKFTLAPIKDNKSKSI